MNRFLFLFVALTATLFAAPVPLQAPVPATAAPPSRWTAAELAHFHAVSAELAKARAAVSAAGTASGVELERARAALAAAEAAAGGELAKALAAVAAAEAQMVALARTPGRPVDPPVIVDPPPPPPPTDPAASPDFSAAPFAALMPEFPRYTFPTLADCEWTIRDGVATSTRGLPSIPFDAEGTVCGWAYRASIAAGHAEPITFGVYDDAGNASVGGYYWHTTGRSICASDGAGGWRPLRVEFLGLTDTAEVGLQWCGTTGGQEWGRTEYVAAFNIGLRGAPSHFGINANKPHGTAILDGCWFMPPKGTETTHHYNAAATFAHSHTLIVRRTKARGPLPTDPNARYYEHNIYFKNAGPGGIWILENHFQGSNGTCFQVRPGTDEPLPIKPNGPVVIAYNRSEGYGWEWGDTPATAHGGSALTVWCVPDHPTFVYRNRITDARYGCLVVSQQGSVPPGYGTPTAPVGSDRNFYGADGYPVGPVYVADNLFTNPRASRQAVSISGCAEAHIWSTNQLEGQWHLNAQWAALNGFRNIPIGAIKLYGGPMQGENFYTFDGTRTRPMTATELEPLRVATPVPLGG